jgi:hypothetical protein
LPIPCRLSQWIKDSGEEDSAEYCSNSFSRSRMICFCRCADWLMESLICCDASRQIRVLQPYLLDVRRIRFFRQLGNLGAEQGHLPRIRQAGIRQNIVDQLPYLVVSKPTSIEYPRSPPALHHLPCASRLRRSRLRARSGTAPTRARNYPTTGTSPSDWTSHIRGLLQAKLPARA